MVGQSIKRLTLIRLVCISREAAQCQDIPLVNQGKWRSKPRCCHFFLLLNIHQRVDLKAVAEHFIIAAHAAHHIDVTIVYLKRLGLNWNLVL